MEFSTNYVLFAVILCIGCNSTRASPCDVAEVVCLTRDVITYVNETFLMYETKVTTFNSDRSVKLNLIHTLLERFGTISAQINAIKAKHSLNIDEALNSMATLMDVTTLLKKMLNGTSSDDIDELSDQDVRDPINSVNMRIHTKSRMIEIFETGGNITLMFQTLESFVGREIEVDSLIHFVRTAVSPNPNGTDSMLRTRHTLLCNVGDMKWLFEQPKNFFKLLLRNYAEVQYDPKYNPKQSAQQFIYSLYTDIALTNLKGYTVMQFSWLIMRLFGKDIFAIESAVGFKEKSADFEHRTQLMLYYVNEAMRDADRCVWRSDPDIHMKSVTYEEVTRLLQGTVKNEKNFHSADNCRETCEFYSSIQSESGSGQLYQCMTMDSSINVCPAASHSTRRYEFIEDKNGRVLGQKVDCPQAMKRMDSWQRWFVRCSYCFCLFDEVGPNSDRYFNLRETVSTIDKNKIVTGLRFVKHNRILHLQLQEGELRPYGTIDATSLSWKPVSDYKIDDESVRNGIDYHTLSYESRAIDLDDVQTNDTSFVVTGVRFRVVDKHLKLNARVTKFNFSTGKLIQPETNSLWMSNEDTDISKKIRIDLSSPDIPTRTKYNSIPKSKHNQYIDFVNTNMDKDAAQSTVPFIDIQDVASYPLVPLSGVGIYYKGRHGYGGFIAPKIISYDITPYMKMSISNGTK